MFVARGHGLIAVIKPSKKAVTHGIELLSRRFVRKSIIDIFEWAMQKKIAFTSLIIVLSEDLSSIS